MSTWIMILWVSGGLHGNIDYRQPIVTQEFNSYRSCITALDYLKKRANFDGDCVAKGDIK